MTPPVTPLPATAAAAASGGPMRRILVIGSGGAGKSWLATRIGERTGLPVRHLDALYWRAGWVETPREEWRATIARLAAERHWVMDGNYGGTMAQRLAACDTAVFLDLPRLVCIARVLRRAIRHRGRSRPDMAEGCPERISLEFLGWVWNYPRDHRPGVLARLREAAAAGTRVVVLRSAHDAERFLAGLSPGVAARAGTA